MATWLCLSFVSFAINLFIIFYLTLTTVHSKPVTHRQPYKAKQHSHTQLYALRSEGENKEQHSRVSIFICAIAKSSKTNIKLFVLLMTTRSKKSHYKTWKYETNKFAMEESNRRSWTKNDESSLKFSRSQSGRKVQNGNGHCAVVGLFNGVWSQPCDSFTSRCHRKTGRAWSGTFRR